MGWLVFYGQGGREQTDRAQGELPQIKAESKKKISLHSRKKGHGTVKPNMQLKNMGVCHQRSHWLHRMQNEI